MCERFPSLRVLPSGTISLPAMFSNPNLIGVSLERPVIDDGDLGLLTDFLVCHVSSGNPLETLVIASHVCQGAVKDIKDMVLKLEVDRLSPLRSFSTCRELQPGTILCRVGRFYDTVPLFLGR